MSIQKKVIGKRKILVPWLNKQKVAYHLSYTFYLIWSEDQREHEGGTLVPGVEGVEPLKRRPITLLILFI